MPVAVSVHNLHTSPVFTSLLGLFWSHDHACLPFHNCVELSEANVGEKVRLSGWINRKRDHGQLVFVDLRDHYGLTQCVVDSLGRLLQSG